MRLLGFTRALGLALGIGAAAFVAVSASAVPVMYNFSSGSVTLTATVGGGTVAGPITLALNGTSVTVDEGALTLNSISLSTGSSPSIPISPTYLGFNSIHLDFATLTAVGGTLTL